MRALVTRELGEWKYKHARAVIKQSTLKSRFEHTRRYFHVIESIESIISLSRLSYQQ